MDLEKQPVILTATAFKQAVNTLLCKLNTLLSHRLKVYISLLCYMKI